MTASSPTGTLHLMGADHAGARFVCATAGTHHLAFPIAAVQEVLAPRTITRLFHAPRSLLGVVNLRGEILPVVDLVQLLGDPGAADSSDGPLDDDARLIVLRARVLADPGATRSTVTRTSSIAVLVAHLDPLRDGDVEPLPAGVPDAVARLALGIVAAEADGEGSARSAVVVIDPDKLVEVEELARLRA